MNIRRHIVNMASASLDSGSYSHAESCPTMNHNIVVGLNGALQKRFVLTSGNNLVPGNVHRASHIDFGVGGKGQDVAITLHCLMEKENFSNNDDIANTSTNIDIRLVQFIGTGFAGDVVHSLLKDRLGKESMELTVRSLSEMRTCTSIVAADETTELVEPSGMITKNELEELFSVISSNRNYQNEDNKQMYPRSLCFMGSMPPGCPEDTYARIYGQLAGPSTVCVVDSLAGIVPLLETISEVHTSAGRSVGAGPTLFKMNASELCKLAGTPKSNNETDGICVSELIGAVEGFLAKYVIPSRSNKSGSSDGVIGIAITDGRHNAYFATIRNANIQDEKVSKAFELFQLPVPNLNNDGTSRTLYPIGAGDAVAAGTVAAWTSLAARGVVPNMPSSFPSAIPDDSLGPLIVFMDTLIDYCSTLSIKLSPVQARAVAAFAFGLACGSASCLQEENSVVVASDVTTLFKETNPCPPKIVIN